MESGLVIKGEAEGRRDGNARETSRKSGGWLSGRERLSLFNVGKGKFSGFAEAHDLHQRGFVADFEATQFHCLTGHFD